MKLVRALTLLTALCYPVSGVAQQIWTAMPVDAASIPRDIVSENRTPAPDGLPDGLMATTTLGTVAAAWYTHPTDRYAHGILGDAIEAGGLRVKTRGGEILSMALPGREVFEDRYPRLADLDGDGTTEIIAIRSSLSAGAAVTVYGVRNGTLRQLATTPFIGTANRWLNIAGIAPFRGGKTNEIAYVQTPHIGGTLFFYAFENDRLVKIAEKYGFSNHWIGSREMRLSAVADADGDGRPDLAVPSANRQTLRIIGLTGNLVTDIASVLLPAPINKAIDVAGTGFTVGLSDGRVFHVAPVR